MHCNPSEFLGSSILKRDFFLSINFLPYFVKVETKSGCTLTIRTVSLTYTYIVGHRITNLSGKYLSQLSNKYVSTYLSCKGATMYYVGNHKRGEWESENHQNMIAVFKLVNYFCNTHISTVICTLLRTKIISRQFSN